MIAEGKNIECNKQLRPLGEATGIPVRDPEAFKEHNSWVSSQSYLRPVLFWHLLEKRRRMETN